MKNERAKELFERFNPKSEVVRCPRGRSIVRTDLDQYARATTHLYGIIRRDEFVEIFNQQNEEKTTYDEVFTLLLPKVLKDPWYAFYKEYIVHYSMLENFDYADYLEREQGNKPRYIPTKEELLKYEYGNYEERDDWSKIRKYMFENFPRIAKIMDAFREVKSYMIYGEGIYKLGPILDKYRISFKNEDQVQEFFMLLTMAKNNTRIWENKGHTPFEMGKLLSAKPSNPIPANAVVKIGPNEPCFCGSGKKFKKCCHLVEISKKAQLSSEERLLFFNTWLKLLRYVNNKLNVVNYHIQIPYEGNYNINMLLPIRDKLWENPKFISEFIEQDESLSTEEIDLLTSWETSHIKGNFVVMKYKPEHAVLMRFDQGVQSSLYAVKGITNSFADTIRRQLPVTISMVLLPFKDKIIYDSLMIIQQISYGPGARAMFEETYTKLESTVFITTKLETSTVCLK